MLVVLVDLIVFAVPLTALAIAYVLLARPPAFVAWVRYLYGGVDEGRRAADLRRRRWGAALSSPGEPGASCLKF
jgi:hypothetical protein